MLMPEARPHVKMLPAVEEAVEIQLPQRMYRSYSCIIGIQFGAAAGAPSRWRKGVSTAKGGDYTGVVVLLANLSFLSLSFLKNMNVLW
jgi:hypothetical protein